MGGVRSRVSVWREAGWQRGMLGFAGMVLVVAAACQQELDERGFRRKAEAVWSEVHPGWTVFRREPEVTVYVRGDQLDRLEVTELFSKYQKAPDGFFDTWRSELQAEVEARHQTLQEARDRVVPVVKGEAWIHARDLGAIGPERIRDQIRPWRTEVADGVYAVLGVPEEKLGYRYASLAEVKSEDDTDWFQQAIGNLERQMADLAEGVTLRDDDGQLMALDLPNRDGVSALILSKSFREDILKRFNKPWVGAAAPIRNVLILFDAERPTVIKPVRARAHELYDRQNHPGFRGLLRLEPDGIEVLEPPRPSATR